MLNQIMRTVEPYISLSELLEDWDSISMALSELQRQRKCQLAEHYEITLSVDEKAKDVGEFLPCDIHGPSRSLMFSKQFIDLLTKLGVNNIQYLNADVTYAPTGEKVSYKVANIVGIVSGLDLDQSTVISSRQGNILEIEEMCIDENKLFGHKIFRLQESIMHVVVHKSIKEAVESAGLTGFMFLADDEYEPGML